MNTDLDFLRFLKGSIGSVWTLELLLILRDTAPRVWAADALIREMRASETVVAGGLRRLEAAGLLCKEPDGVRFAPASPALAALVDSLAISYRESPVSLVSYLATPGRDQLQALADAFRLKGDK